MGGAGGSCFDHRPSRPHFHGNNLTYYLLPTILLPINDTPYYPQKWPCVPPRPRAHFWGQPRESSAGTWQVRNRSGAGRGRPPARRSGSHDWRQRAGNAWPRASFASSMNHRNRVIVCGWHSGVGLNFNFFVFQIDGN